MGSVKFVDEIDQGAIFEGNGWDALVVVTADLASLQFEEIVMLASHGQKIDKRVGQSATLLFAPGMAGGRLIIAPVKKADDDYQDVRVFADAARQGIKLAKDAGAKRPLLIVNNLAEQRYQNAAQVAALACGQELWQALELREAGGGEDRKSVV